MNPTQTTKLICGFGYKTLYTETNVDGLDYN